jgi:hypothetical protein
MAGLGLKTRAGAKVGAGPGIAGAAPDPAPAPARATQDRHEGPEIVRSESSVLERPMNHGAASIEPNDVSDLGDRCGPIGYPHVVCSSYQSRQRVAAVLGAWGDLIAPGTRRTRRSNEARTEGWGHHGGRGVNREAGRAMSESVREDRKVAGGRARFTMTTRSEVRPLAENRLSLEACGAGVSFQITDMPMGNSAPRPQEGITSRAL